MKTNFLILALTLSLFSCINHNPEKKEIEDISESDSFFFSHENSCEEQSKYAKSSNKVSMYYFDDNGFMDENVYKKMPSYTLLYNLRSDSNFINLASKNFDFVVFDQACSEGQKKYKSFDVVLAPTILLVDEDENIIHKIVGLSTVDYLIQEIQEKLKK
ncbi:MAG: hypothetical protein H6600_07040 [Flavobacteriales bacterium]|nr:hypothetical protein [Flavobacteriales bacterium]